MNIELTNSNTTTNYTFNVNHKGEEFHVIVFVDSRGKFVDDVITRHDGEELEYEGEEGQIREDILSYIDDHWNKLIG